MNSSIENLCLLSNKFLEIVLEVGLYLDKEPIKFTFITSILIDYYKFSFF
jgi:hypothetical protein